MQVNIPFINKSDVSEVVNNGKHVLFRSSNPINLVRICDVVVALIEFNIFVSFAHLSTSHLYYTMAQFTISAYA